MATLSQTRPLKMPKSTPNLTRKISKNQIDRPTLIPKQKTTITQSSSNFLRNNKRLDKQYSQELLNQIKKTEHLICGDKNKNKDKNNNNNDSILNSNLKKGRDQEIEESVVEKLDANNNFMERNQDIQSDELKVGEIIDEDEEKIIGFGSFSCMHKERKKRIYNCYLREEFLFCSNTT